MQRNSLIVYDLVGTAVALGVGAIGLWCGLLKPETSSDRLASLESQLIGAKTALQQTQAELHRQSAGLKVLEEDLTERGALPQQSPVETDLRIIARLARDNKVEISGITPSGEKDYPGIRELRYSLDGRADSAGLLGFLRAFEQSPFWADIISIKVDNQKKSRQGRSKLCSVQFLVTLYASESQSSAAGEGA